MSIGALHAGLSGLKAFQSALDNNANNIANASTKNYQVASVSFQEGANGGVVVNISKASEDLARQEIMGEPSNSSSTDLANELTQQLQFKAGFQISAKLIDTADEVFNSILKLQE